MDYSPKRRIAAGATRALVLVGLVLVGAGCPENAGTNGRVETAESLYRQGRAIEDRVSGSESEARANLQQARTLYIRALGQDPSDKLDAYIRAGLGNVAFYQDDYKTAVEQWGAAYDRLDDPGARSMTLLRMGMARQRMGQFDQADRLFAMLQQQYPGSMAAQSARGKAGARGFYVQVAVFSTPALADKAVGQLRKDGFTAAKTPDAQGRQVIRVGPVGSYAEAVRAKQRLAGSYPTAIVTP